MFVLTSQHNDYDQHGEYFIAAWYELPEAPEIAEVLMKDAQIAESAIPSMVEHLLSGNGGGRREPRDENGKPLYHKWDDVWYHLKPYKE